MHKKAGYKRPHSDKKVLLSCSTHAAAPVCSCAGAPILGVIAVTVISQGAV